MSPPVRLADGVRFGCTRCGHCCRQPGFVWLTVDEMADISAHLDLTVDDFQARYQVEWDSNAQSYRIDAVKGYGCPLLVGNDCSVHPVKPMQCRTFPFWPELLDDRDEWVAAKQYCPGMDAPSGKLFAASEIRKLRRTASSR